MGEREKERERDSVCVYSCVCVCVCVVSQFAAADSLPVYSFQALRRERPSFRFVVACSRELPVARTVYWNSSEGTGTERRNQQETQPKKVITCAEIKVKVQGLHICSLKLCHIFRSTGQ